MPQQRLAPEHLRHEQISAVARRTGLMAMGSVLSCLMVMATFWPTASHRYLLLLLGLLLVLHAIAVVGSRVWLARATRTASPRDVHLRVALTALIALVWASVPGMLMPDASADHRQLLIYIASGLLTSSILLAPLPAAALLFAAVTSIGVLLPMPQIYRSITSEHATLVLMFFVMNCGVVLNQGRDFAEHVLNELTLAEQGDIIGLLLRDFEENASDWLWETDAELRLSRVSPRLADILGCDQADLRGISVPEWVARDALLAGEEEHDAARMLACLADRQPFHDLQVLATFGGTTCWFSIAGKPVLDATGAFCGYRGVGSDLTAARRSDERIAYLARYDSLTGLPNRSLFQDALDRVCADSEPFALLCLDLDGFKAVNDTLGHGMGDALLVAVAGRLRACLRDGDVVARLGGDEFAVLQAGGDGESAASLAQRLVARIAEPFQLSGAPTSVGLSVGVALASQAGTPEDLLRGADLALYHSKAEGRGTWHFFEAGMALRAQQRHALQVDLRHAIEHDELILEFQPILDFATDEVIGAECLVRWLHPVRGRVPPADFIPAAEESGLIVALGAWVLRRACREAVSWRGTARVAVNLSPLQFRDPGLLALVDAVLAESGLPASRLELEITESVFLDAVDSTLVCLHALRSRGIHIALDDFGTGYSSLSYLRSFPFDKVKIDQSFIHDLSVNKEAIAIVQAIVGMAGCLGMRTTGEGVETSAQAELLRSTGCSQVQGYLFGRPCSPDAIAGLMADGHPPPDRPGLVRAGPCDAALAGLLGLV